jgi:hypothetical protein
MCEQSTLYRVIIDSKYGACDMMIVLGIVAMLTFIVISAVHASPR